ncbi:hypothetical protein trd_0304 [Thermomicrobium roseum DSM 5159]|uniref:Uncharacterized protein n=1 Tax=Thermomicrobium roseum (strain ATCC 27502 / DSM 5159 / P-2) TaxID=309801 RepID=B9KXW2_THERP|nr:hypothetical protein trd_0304 [Thermomicrobium roseum DSM 5159]
MRRGIEDHAAGSRSRDHHPFVYQHYLVFLGILMGNAG